MKIAFFIAAAAMVALALAVLLVPLVRRGRDLGRPGHIFALCLAIAFVLPLSALGLYLHVGMPAALDGLPRQQAAPMTMQQALAALRSHLAAQPGDGQGWLLLAQSLAGMHDPAGARDAYDHVLRLDPGNADAMVGWAESDAAQRGDHRIDGRAFALLRQVASVHPDNQRALWLLGIGQFQQGRYREAAATWRLLQPQLVPGSLVARTVAEQVAAADVRAGDAPPAATSSTSSTSSAASAASAASAKTDTAPGLDVLVTLTPALRARVAAGDVLYVFARAPHGSPMPLAVDRIDPVRLPVRVRLTDAMAMLPGHALSSVREASIGARISHSGQPLPQPGDLEGDAGTVDTRTTRTVHLTIDTVRP